MPILTNNICKYISKPLPETLSINYFVRETNSEIMTVSIMLKTNRLILVTGGNGEFSFDETIIRSRPGMLIFAFEGEKMQCLPCSDTSYIYIAFDGTRADELFQRFGICFTNRVFEGYDALIPLWNESLSRATEKSIDLAAESMLLYTFSRMDAAEDKSIGITHRVISIIKQDFANTELSVASVAESLSYNSKYLSHIFKKNTGTSFSDYLRTTRIKHSIMLFDHGLESVKNIAILSGFSDPLYFSTVFKKETGLSPSEYKAKVQGE